MTSFGFAVGGSGNVISALGVLTLLVIGAALGGAGAVGLVRRDDPATRAARAVSYGLLLVAVVATCVAVYSVVAAIGAPSTDAPFRHLQHVQGLVAGGSIGGGSRYTTVFGVASARNRLISTAVVSGLFAVTNAAAYLVGWPRARRGALERARALAAGYGYLVAVSASAGLVLSVPLTGFGVYEALAPGVAATSRPDGIGDGVAAAAVSAALVVVLAAHLRLAREAQLPEPTVTETDTEAEG